MLKIVMTCKQFDAAQADLDPSVMPHIGVYYPFKNITLKSNAQSDNQIWISDGYSPSITDVTYVVLDPLYPVTGHETEWKAETIALSDALKKLRESVTSSLLQVNNDKIAHQVFDQALGVDDVIDDIEGI